MADEQGKMEDRVNGGASGCHLVCWWPIWTING